MRVLFLLFALLPAAASAERWSRAEFAGILSSPQLSEVSGLTASRTHPGIYFAHNDGGNDALLLAIRSDGSLVATFPVEGADNIDWEDMASFQMDGRNFLVVADTGDNGGIRTGLTLHVFEEPSGLRDGDHLKPAWSIGFSWPDGARDCEAVAVDAAHGDILLISKKRVPPELFRLPLRPGPGMQVAERVAVLSGIEQPSTLDLQNNPTYGRYRSQVTSADLSPNGRVLAVLNYHSVYLYVRAPGQAWSGALSAPARLQFPWLPQAEGIAFAADGRSLLIASEKRPTPLLRFRIIR